MDTQEQYIYDKQEEISESQRWKFSHDLCAQTMMLSADT